VTCKAYALFKLNHSNCSKSYKIEYKVTVIVCRPVFTCGVRICSFSRTNFQCFHVTTCPDEQVINEGT